MAELIFLPSVEIRKFSSAKFRKQENSRKIENKNLKLSPLILRLQNTENTYNQRNLSNNKISHSFESFLSRLSPDIVL